ncbi:MAG: GTPase KRas precursor [Candidatus Heimdallarchaeota archaeon LC_2]|nr:MAG: GTPase KRas precursor [Candidatus Heimdallarchaeota archaeon LC_2]
MTIGADFAAKKVRVTDSLTITANIWDLAGQDRFQRMRSSYYNGLGGALLVYDITRPDTFEKLKVWINELREQNEGKLVPLIIIGNKSDLRGTSEFPDNYIEKERCEEFCENIRTEETGDIQFVETSALTGEQVEEAFQTLILKIVKEYRWI